MADKNIGFFSDIKNYIIGILAGLVSIGTVIPLFLNNLDKLFGIHTFYAYNLFVFLYFIAPIIFFSLCYKVSTIRSNKNQKLYIFLTFLILVVYCYLIIPSPVLFYLVGSFLVSYAIHTIIQTTYFIKKNILRDLGVAKSNLRSNTLKLRREYFLLVAILTLALCLLLNRFWQTELMKQPRLKGLIKYTIVDQTSSLSHYDYFNKSYKKCLIDEAAHTTDRILLNYYLLNASPYPIKKSSHLCNLHASDHHTNVEDAIKDVGKLRAPEGEYFKARMRQEAGKLLVADYSQKLEEKFETLLNALQLRSFIWFYFVLIVALSIWIRERVNLDEQQKKDQNLDTIKSGPSTGVIYGRYKRLKMISVDEKEYTQVHEIQKTKAFIYSILLLIIPFYKTIDRDSLDLEKPFLNFSLKELMTGNIEVDMGKEDESYNTMTNRITIDTSTINADVIVHSIKDSTGFDSVLDELKRIKKIQLKQAEIEYSDDDFKTIEAEDSLKE